MKEKYLLLLFAALAATLPVSAQRPNRQPDCQTDCQTDRQTNCQADCQPGRLIGRITETPADLPVPFADVLLLDRDSVCVGGTASDRDGYFAFSALPAGADRLAVSFVGYRTAFVALPDGAASDTLRIVLTPSETLLEDVVVRGRRVIVKEDRRVVLPSAEQLRISTDALDLLRRLRLPRIAVNPLTGEIAVSGNGTVRLCINGVQATSAELAAVPPADILRIEYHDDPGARWGDADAVIDCITRRHESGGNLNCDLFNGVGNGHFALDALAAKWNRGKSEWSFTTQYMQVRRNAWIRDYDERRCSPDGEELRREVGSPVPIDVRFLDAALNYSLADADDYLLSLRFGYALNDTPASEEGDRRNLLYLSGSDTPVSVFEHLTERSGSPSLDLYFRKALDDDSQLIFDAVGTCIRTTGRRIYRESHDRTPIADILSDIRGRKYSLIAEGMYERRIGTHTIVAGLRYLRAHTENDYSGTASAHVALRQTEGSAYAEYRRRTGRWGYMANLTVSRLDYAQKELHTRKYAFQPSVRLSFDPDDRSYLRYGAELRTHIPALSAMNDVEQEIDAGQVRRGNPALKPFRTLEQTLSAGIAGDLLGVDLSVGYRHEFRPIMETVGYEEGRFVRMSGNQRSFRKLSAEATVVLRPWGDRLSISLTPEVNRYISRGNSYRHTCTIPNLRLDVDLCIGCWLLGYNTLTGYANYLYGERVMKERNMHLLMTGYKRPAWSLQVGVLNPFYRRYWMETVDRSAAVSSVSRAYTDRSRSLLVKLNVSLSRGRRSAETRREIRHEDTDAGIMQGTR